MLVIKDLHANVNGKEILSGINLVLIQEKFMLLWVRTVQEKVLYLPF